MTVPTFVESIYLDSKIGIPTELESAGTCLENAFAYDSAARDLKAMADRGLVKILSERLSQWSSNVLIRHISFEKLR